MVFRTALDSDNGVLAKELFNTPTTPMESSTWFIVIVTEEEVSPADVAVTVAVPGL